MPTDVDRQIARSAEVMYRSSDRRASISSRARARRSQRVMRKLGRIMGAALVVLVGAVAVGWFVPLGIGGIMIVLALLAAVTLLLALWPVDAPVPVEKLPEVDLKLLPLRTEQWLEQQRPALPAPAVRLVDDIGARLEALAPQLVGLNPNEPAAAEVRKLVGEQLPELLKSYQRVPEPLRTTPRNGVTPDTQLVDGLKLIENEIGEMTMQLAQGDLDTLATRGRFLEIKYRGDPLD